MFLMRRPVGSPLICVFLGDLLFYEGWTMAPTPSSPFGGVEGRYVAAAGVGLFVYGIQWLFRRKPGDDA